MTLLLRGHCAVDYMEASKKTKLEARLARAIESLSSTNCTFHGLLWLRLSHHRFHSLSSRLVISLCGNAAFLGALAIDGFLGTGAAFTGTVDAELGDAGAGCELEDGTIDTGGC